MSESTPAKPGSATAAATPPSGVAAITPPGTRSLTRTSCSTQDKLIGRCVGKARILKRLGRGGMGDVYLAQHADYDKAVAIKILPPDLTRNDELLQRFRREAESAARLEDPNLVEIYDVGEENGFHYILMAFVAGRRPASPTKWPWASRRSMAKASSTATSSPRTSSSPPPAK